MKKKALAICITCLLLSGCGGEVSEEETKNETQTDTGTIKQMTTEKTVDIEESKDGAEKITEILNSIQATEELTKVDFYGDNMFVLSREDEKINLYSYNMNNWDEKKIDTGIQDDIKEWKESIQIPSDVNVKLTMNVTIIPCSKGVVVTASKAGFDVEYNYIFDDELNLLAKCDGLLADYSASGDTLYYYDKGKIYAKEINTGKVSTIREYTDSEEHQEGEIASIGQICMSDDKRYIFYTGRVWHKNNTEPCWGYIDPEDSNNDVMYEESKRLIPSENGVLVVDEPVAYMMGQLSTVSKEMYYYTGGINKQIRQVEDVDEVLLGTYSGGGNIFITSYYHNKQSFVNETATIYDIKNNKVIAKYEDDERNWIDDSSICEKYRLCIYLDPIHESPDRFSPTGKSEILWLNY